MDQSAFISWCMRDGVMFINKIALKLLNIQFIKFILVGGINTVFGLIIYILFLEAFEVDKVFALLATYIVGITFNFFSIGLGVFRKIKLTTFAPFFCTYIVIYGINYVLLDYLVGSGHSEIMGQVLLVLPMALLAFSILKIIYAKID